MSSSLISPPLGTSSLLSFFLFDVDVVVVVEDDASFDQNSPSSEGGDGVAAIGVATDEEEEEEEEEEKKDDIEDDTDEATALNPDAIVPPALVVLFPRGYLSREKGSKPFDRVCFHKS